jgi:light-regulated signal transduction histidine kinase (bacteriophytochrome)
LREKDRISPKTFERKKVELENWVEQEKKSIQKTKKELEQSALATAETIRKTQRDLEFMSSMKNKKMKRHNSHELRDI